MDFPARLIEYPYPVVWVTCRLCPHRRGRYNLQRLVFRFGAEALLDHVRRALAQPCPRLRLAGKALDPGCMVQFPDLWTWWRDRNDP